MKRGTIEPPKITEQYYIQAKSSEWILCPANAIAREFYTRAPNIEPELVTNDGVIHKCQFVSTWNNRDGVYEDEFECVCQRLYNMSFESIRSMWIGRLGRLDDYWHLIKLD